MMHGHMNVKKKKDCVYHYQNYTTITTFEWKFKILCVFLKCY